MLTLSSKIEFMKFIKEKFIGKNLRVEFFYVVEYATDFGVVETIDIADDKISVWGAEDVFWIYLDDIKVVNYNPREEDVCLLIEGKNNVEVHFKVE